jgi:hypothetical protein
VTLSQALERRVEPPTRRVSLAIGVVAALVTAFVAWRATLGVSGFDDSYYVAIALRLAGGARPLADEWTLQVLGALPTVPFVLAWKALFGTAWLAFALRMLCVATAWGVWYACYRALRPTFGATFSAMSAALPLLAPPFSIFMLSYNTVSMFGLVLGCVLSFAALRDRRMGTAVAASVACGFAGAAYPPLALPAGMLMLLASFLAWRLGAPRLILGIWLPALLMAGAAVAWLLSSATPHEIKIALRYSRETWADIIKPWARRAAIWRVREAFTIKWVWPLWLTVTLASVPWRDRRIGAIAAAAAPLAALLPGVVAIVRDRNDILGWSPSAYLFYVIVATSVVALAWVVRERDAQVGVLLGLAAPAALVGVPLVYWSTSAGIFWAIPIVAAATIGVGSVLGWLRLVETAGVRWLPVTAWAALLLGLVALLSLHTFKDGRPFELNARIPSGPLAGLATTAANRDWILGMQAMGARLVDPDDRVFVVGRPIGYLLLGGRMYTNAVWLNLGKTDTYAPGYFDKQGVYPDHIFIASSVFDRYGSVQDAGGHDPLVRWALKRYRLIGNEQGYVHFVPRGDLSDPR